MNDIWATFPQHPTINIWLLGAFLSVFHYILQAERFVFHLYLRFYLDLFFFLSPLVRQHNLNDRLSWYSLYFVPWTFSGFICHLCIWYFCIGTVIGNKNIPLCVLRITSRHSSLFDKKCFFNKIHDSKLHLMAFRSFQLYHMIFLLSILSFTSATLKRSLKSSPFWEVIRYLYTVAVQF